MYERKNSESRLTNASDPVMAGLCEIVIGCKLTEQVRERSIRAHDDRTWKCLSVNRRRVLCVYVSCYVGR